MEMLNLIMLKGSFVGCFRSTTIWVELGSKEQILYKLFGIEADKSEIEIVAVTMDQVTLLG